MTKEEAENLSKLFKIFANNLEFCFNQDDLDYINKTKKDFDKNNMKAINKYQNKIRSQSLKSNY